MVNAYVSRNASAGDIVIGSDGWTGRQRTSISNVMRFTPEPLYVETGVWAEERHTAHNKAQFVIKRIVSLGKRNVSGFVSGT